MRTPARLISLVCFAIALAQSLALWHSTGGALFTKIPSARLAAMKQPAAADDAFAGLGMNDLSGEPTKVDNEFRLGLLPAGPGNGFADSASVLTFTGPAFVLLVVTWFATRRRATKKA